MTGQMMQVSDSPVFYKLVGGLVAWGVDVEDNNQSRFDQLTKETRANLRKGSKFESHVRLVRR